MAGDHAVVFRDDAQDARELLVRAPRVVVDLGGEAPEAGQRHEVLELEIELRHVVVQQVLVEEIEQFGHGVILPEIERVI